MVCSAALVRFAPVAALWFVACANSSPPPPPLESITAEQDCWGPVRVVPPHLMAKGRGASPHAARLDAAAPVHADTCPLRVPGTNVSAQPVEEGVALYFTTHGDVAELRQRVRRLAYTHTHEGVASDEPGCGCPLVGNDGVPLMAEASTSAEPTPRGARLVLIPNERNEAPRLRERVTERLDALAAADCPLIDELLQRDQTARR